MNSKTALIFGVTGQDGAYLTRLLLKKGYKVHGVKRRSSSFNTSRLDDLYVDPVTKKTNFRIHYGDITDPFSITNLIKKHRPDEVYNSLHNLMLQYLLKFLNIHQM